MSATNVKSHRATAPESAPKTAKLFKNGRSQAVRLPKEFTFEGTEISVRRDPLTKEVILSPLGGTLLDPWEMRFAVWDALGLPGDEELERDQAPPLERDFF